MRWYRNDLDVSDSFSTPSSSLISTAGNRVISVYATDFDGDGDIDVLVGSQFDDEVRWYRNDLDVSDSFSRLSSSLISRLNDGVRSVYAADLNGDGNSDVLAGSNNDDEVRWYLNRIDYTIIPYLADQDIVEGNSGSVLDTILIFANGPITETITLYYHLEGTAVRGQDFQSELPDTGEIVVLPGNIGILPFSILGDLIPDNDVEILVVVDDIIVNNSCSRPDTFTVRLGILEDDIGVEISNAVGTEGDTLRFIGSLNAPPRFDTLSFDYTLVEQTATVAGGDLREIFEGSFVFAQGSDETEFEIVIPTLDNTDVDGLKTFLLIFSNIENGTFQNDTSTGIIIDDESAVPDVEMVFCEQDTISTQGDAVRSVYAADLDGDGDLDVLAPASTSEFPSPFKSAA